MYTIFSKSRGFKDFKYICHMTLTLILLPPCVPVPPVFLSPNVISYKFPFPTVYFDLVQFKAQKESPTLFHKKFINWVIRLVSCVSSMQKNLISSHLCLKCFILQTEMQKAADATDMQCNKHQYCEHQVTNINKNNDSYNNNYNNT